MQKVKKKIIPIAIKKKQKIIAQIPEEGIRIRRKSKIISGVVGLALIFAGLFTFSGGVTINAWTYTPTGSGMWNGYEHTSGIAVDVIENGNKIGTSNEPIFLTTGKHTLTFGNYNDFWCESQNVEVNVNPLGWTNLDVVYRPTWGMLQIKTTFTDKYTQQGENGIQAKIFVDGQEKGTNSALIRYEQNELGPHTITSETIPGYYTPAPSYETIQKGTITTITLNYQKILTSEQTHEIWLKQKTNYLTEMDTQSNVFYDRFYKWVLDNKVGVPLCYYEIDERPSRPNFNVYVAQYAGALQSERSAVLDSIYRGLLNSGTNIESKGNIVVYHISNEAESVITIKLSFEFLKTAVESNTYSPDIYGFDSESTNIIPNFFPNIIPAGVAYDFSTSELYVKVGEATRPIDDVYTGFQKFTNVDSIYEGASYNAYKSLSIKTVTNYFTANEIDQLRQIIEGGVMSTTLLNPAGFCRSLLWT